MAVRRMFHADVIGSDSFLDMPFSAQMLYVQITMAADDDGFFNGARRLARLIGTGARDLELLVKKRFLLQFGDVVVVKHWRMANSLKTDRMKWPSYPEIADRIYIKKNRAYTDHPTEGEESLLQFRKKIYLERNPNGFQMESQEKGREENRKEENRKEDKVAEAEGDGIQTAAADTEPFEKMDGNLGKGVLMLTRTQTEDLLETMGLDGFDYYTDKLSSFILEKGAKVKNHYATLLRWWQEDQKVRGDYRYE